MVKKTALLILFCTLLSASEFDKNCLSCHEGDFKFHIIMKKYTLKYSSEKRIKEAIYKYLKEPTAERSILPSEYIKRFGIKERSDLDDETLRQMIDIYYQEYNLPSKLY
jgi:hypothetical protein